MNIGLKNWKQNNVYEEVPYTGQNYISTRWVITEKSVNDVKKIKARLVARGFEEFEKTRTDSPTCSKECLRLVLAIISSKRWECHSLDIKSAFLQGRSIDREVYLLPPSELEKYGVLWKLKTCIYGLSDASRMWYFGVREELIKLGAKYSKFDAALFYWQKDGVLQGLMSTHVDDFCWGGTGKFYQEVIVTLHKIFEVGTEYSSSFKYVGLNIQQDETNIELDQQSYISSIEPIKIGKERQLRKQDPVSEQELTNLRKLVGQLSWVATQTRPDILFECCDLMSNVKTATVSELIRANKVLKQMKDIDVTIKFPVLNDIENATILSFQDASYANLTNGGSQGGNIIFLVDSQMNVAPISWQSKRLRRVVKSTLGAETLALVDAAETSFWISSIMLEIFNKNQINERIHIECRTDNHSLFEAVHSTTSLTDKRLRVDMAILREMKAKDEITNVVWIPRKEQLADCLTKRGASAAQLLHVLETGKLMS